MTYFSIHFVTTFVSAHLENNLKCLKKLLSDSWVDVIGSQTYFSGHPVWQVEIRRRLQFVTISNISYEQCKEWILVKYTSHSGEL